MPRDKVGIVGRNGAGKTSLFKVLGGAVEPAAGSVVRKGGFGYLPQDPRIDQATGESHGGHARAVGTWHRRRAGADREAAPGDGGDPDRAQRRPLQPRRGELPGQRRIRRRERGPGAGGRARSRRDPHGAADRRAVGRRAAACRAGADPVRRQRRAVPRRADQPPRRRRQAVADGLPPSVPRRAARDQPRPRPARRGDHAGPAPRPAHRDRGRHDRRVPRHLQPVHRRPRRGRAPAGQAGGPAEQGDRPPAAVSSTASAPRPPRRRWRTASRSASIALEDDRVHAPKHTRAIAVRFPDPPACGQTVLVAEHLCKGYGGPPVFEDVGFDLGRGERLLVLGLNGAGKTSLLRILAGESEADLGQFDVRPQRDARLLRPGARQPRPGRVVARQPPRRRAARHQPHRDRAARPARDDGPVGREGVPGCRARCRAARRPSWRWRC